MLHYLANLCTIEEVDEKEKKYTEIIWKITPQFLRVQNLTRTILRMSQNKANGKQ
jgi:hypothetical protein